ncbi:MAG: holin, partial [Nitrospiraceae bacterium]
MSDTTIQMLSDSLTALLPVLIPVIVAKSKALFGRLPRVCIPLVAILLGAGIELINTYLTGGSLTNAGVIGGVLGAAGVGLREVFDQLRKSMVVNGTKVVLLLLLFGTAAGCAGPAYVSCKGTGKVSGSFTAMVYT